MHNASEVIWLDDLGAMRVRGPDAARFLQGQLSNDLMRLSAGNSLLAGYHTPQGRTIAVLRLVYWDEGDVVAVVPRGLIATVASRIGKFVLRSKVKITDESASWRIGGVVGATKVADAAAGALAETVGAQSRAGDAVFVRLAGDRALVVSYLGTSSAGSSQVGTPRLVTDERDTADHEASQPASATGPRTGTSPSDSVVGDLADGDLQAWRRLEVAAGEPQVYPETAEEFVAQMLNLDVLHGIAFDKGCYTGQEVIARAHYRGKVKRRMQRFITRDPHRLTPGDSGQLTDGRTFKVVLAAQLEDGRCDFLAVAPLVGAEPEAAAAGATHAASTSAATLTSAAPPTSVAPAAAPALAITATAVTVAVPVAADPAPLPYALPD
jgi:tRNA-modifying protein YgfZ